jgi:hypothetical protein
MAVAAVFIAGAGAGRGKRAGMKQENRDCSEKQFFHRALRCFGGGA